MIYATQRIQTILDLQATLPAAIATVTICIPVAIPPPVYAHTYDVYACATGEAMLLWGLNL